MVAGYRIQKCLNLFILVFVTLWLLFGCSLEAGAAEGDSDEEVKSRVARVIDSELENVIPLLEDELSLEFDDAMLLHSADGGLVVSRAIEESGGMEYLHFADRVASATSAEEVVAAARNLVPEEEYERLLESVAEQESRARELFDEHSRAMTSAQQRAFYKDLKAMVIKATVLLTAGLVYACMPKAYFWGKVSAACAVSVAAGITASGILNVIEYYKYGTEFESLDEWLANVYSTAYGEWALASTIIATGTAAKRSAVVTGLIVVVYALYGVLDNMKPLMSKYGFSLG